MQLCSFGPKGRHGYSLGKQKCNVLRARSLTYRINRKKTISFLVLIDLFCIRSQHLFLKGSIQLCDFSLTACKASEELNKLERILH